MTALALRPNTELVTVAYVRDEILAGFDVGVGNTLPGPDPETNALSWGSTGFVVVSGITGQVNRDVPMRQPSVSLDVYAANVAGKKPPWGRAFAIAEALWAWQFDTETHDTQRPVALPTGYPGARVAGYSTLTEPSRRLSSPANYARVGLDVAISWHPLG